MAKCFSFHFHFEYFPLYACIYILIEVIYQTGETVFHRHIQTPRREVKIRRAAEYF